MKRVFDIVLAAAGLAVVSPLLLALAAWIKLDSPGPVFYRGVRAGKWGRPFRIFKLRTMVVNAEQLGGAETPNGDPRITCCGQFLRHYKLDEFPQLINVLLGQMSLVGPRPEVMEEVACYTAEEQEVLNVRPGITDWASLRFHHEGDILEGSSDPHRTYHEKIRPEKMRLQRQYVQGHSLSSDIKIILRTLRVIYGRPAMNRFGSAASVAASPGVKGEARATPAPWPHYSEEEIAAVTSILRSGKVNYWTGNQGRQFEREFAEFCGAKYAVAVANGSVALELALYALGVGPGDEVIVPSRTFIASASCALVRGATPVFADVDPVSQNLTPESIEQVLTPRTKAIIAVHLAGWPCDMDGLLALARKHSLYLIEDCAQAHGAAYRGRRVGSMGDIAAFSFCQDKIISTGGEGGMVVANDRRLWETMWSYKDHGRNCQASHAPAQPGFRWIHDSFGTNFRLTEMQAAIGRIQLSHIEQQLAQRRRHAAVLNQHFAATPGLRVTLPPADVEHAYYKYYVFVEPGQLVPGWNRDQILKALSTIGTQCTAGSCSEVYLEQAFPESMRPARRLPNARQLGETSLMFPVHPTLTETDLHTTCAAVETVMQAATKNAWLRAAS